MFAASLCPGLPAWPTRAAPDYRRLTTRRGTYYVPWERPAVAALIRSEGLGWRDFLTGDRTRLQALARDLFLLDLGRAMAPPYDEADSALTRLARRLVRESLTDGARRHRHAA
jgi:hypothetical protein